MVTTKILKDSDCYELIGMDKVVTIVVASAYLRLATRVRSD